MGAVGGMLGLGGGQGGTGFSTQNGTNQQQMQQAYNGQQAAMGNQNALLGALQGQNGLGNQSQVYNQFQGVANGQGPNPAQAMLNQATGANVANQAALMGGQRGASGNVGLMARQAGQQGGALQQQAAGQGASMQAQQSLGALGQAAGMANQMAGQQIGQTNQNVASQQNEQNMLLNANNANNTNQTQMANTRMGQQSGMLGGVMNGIGSMTGLFAQGGPIQQQTGAQSMFGKSLSTQPMMAEGGMVPAMVSPEEIILSPEEAKMVAEGRAKASQIGEKVPGKAPVKGNSYKNDVVKKHLPEGGVVVPNTKTQAKNPDKKSADFVRAVMSKKKAKK